MSTVVKMSTFSPQKKYFEDRNLKNLYKSRKNLRGQTLWTIIYKCQRDNYGKRKKTWKGI